MNTQRQLQKKTQLVNERFTKCVSFTILYLKVASLCSHLDERHYPRRFKCASQINPFKVASSSFNSYNLIYGTKNCFTFRRVNMKLA